MSSTGAAAAPTRPPFSHFFTKLPGKVGDGAFGAVYMVEAKEPGLELLRARGALGAGGAPPRLIGKFPKPAFDSAEVNWKELESERERLAQKWGHRGIVAYIGHFPATDDLGRNVEAIVMEACLGMGDGEVPVVIGKLLKTDEDFSEVGASKGDFWRWVATRAAPSDACFRFIAWQLLAATAFLHANGVAHRDLKNENFLVAGAVKASCGDVPVVKLSDFGSARQLDPEAQAGVPPTRSGTVIRYVAGQPKWVGTAQHIAPELLHAGIMQAHHRNAPTDPAAAAARAESEDTGSVTQFNARYSTKCDIYSLGIALFATLSYGEKPLGGQPGEDVVRIHGEIFDEEGSWLAAAARKLRTRKEKTLQGHFTTKVCAVPADTIAFILSMMSIAPEGRPTAAALLASDYFSAIREEARALFGDERVPEAAASGGGGGGGEAGTK